MDVSLAKGSCAEQMIEHQVNDHTRARDVDPQGISPARNGLVFEIAATQAVHESDDDQRDDGSGKEGVADQDREVNGPRPALSLKTDAANVSVIPQVRNQEETRSTDGGDHQRAVGRDLTAADLCPSGSHQHGAGAVQTSVDHREDRVVGHDWIMPPAWSSADSR